METQEIIEEVGLSEQEAKVYLALLKLGTSLASRVSSETKINRSLVYQLLDKLINKGFVSYVIRENRRYYRAVHPEKLLDILKEKEEKLKSMLPKLTSLYPPKEKKPVVEVLEGKEGIKTMLKDIFRVNKTWYAFGSSGTAPEILPYFVEHWEKERQRRKIKLVVICNDSPAGRKRGKEFSKMKFTEVKYMPNKYISPTSTWIYGYKLAFIMWSKEHPFAIRIISKEMVESYRNHFNVLWKIAKK